MKFRLDWKECENLGELGWIVTQKDGKKIDYPGHYTTIEPRLLAHDLLEHEYIIQNENLEELKALGAFYYNRENDFCNTRGDCMAFYEIGRELCRLYEEGATSQFYNFPSSQSVEIKDWIEEMWPGIYEFVKVHSNLELPLRAKAATYHWLAVGYNRMVGISKRYGCDTKRIFWNLEAFIDKVLKYYCRHNELALSIKINLRQRKFTASELVIGEDYWNESWVYRRSASY